MVNPQDADNMKESPIILWLRDKMSSHPISKDQDTAKAANAVEASSDTVHMAKGGDVPEKKDSDYGTLVGLRELLRKSSGQMPEPSTGTVHMADGGYPTEDQGLEGLPPFDVANPSGSVSMNGSAESQGSQPPSFIDPSDIPPAVPDIHPAEPEVPAISSMMQTLHKTPDTNYDFYKNMSAEDRAALLQKLTQQQHSGGNLLASGAAGLGDAIARSFGHQHTDYQKNVEEGAQKAKDEAVAGLDTQRTQKLQDVQANQQAELDDPNSRFSQVMRQTFKSAGINVPSGMPGSIMMKIAPDLGNFALKQATLGVLSGKNQMEARQQLETRLADINKSLAGAGITSHMMNSGDLDAMRQEASMIKAQLANMGVALPSTNALPKVGQSIPHASGAIITRNK